MTLKTSDCHSIIRDSLKNSKYSCILIPTNNNFSARWFSSNPNNQDKPVLIAGDFNARPDSPEIAELKKGFTILSDTSKPTFRADNPSLCIDYIMVDSAHADKVEVQSYETIPDPVATDHCGLVLKATFKN